MKNFNSFLLHFSLSAVILLLANAWFIYLNHNIPDGRITFMLPISSAFILVYAVIVGVIGMSFLGKNFYHWMTRYVVVLSILFVFLAPSVYFFFQDVHFLPKSILQIGHMGIFPFSDYFVILGTGLALFPLFILGLRRTKLVAF